MIFAWLEAGAVCSVQPTATTGSPIPLQGAITLPFQGDGLSTSMDAGAHPRGRADLGRAVFGRHDRVREVGALWLGEIADGEAHRVGSGEVPGRIRGAGPSALVSAAVLPAGFSRQFPSAKTIGPGPLALPSSCTDTRTWAVAGAAKAAAGGAEPFRATRSEDQSDANGPTSPTTHCARSVTDVLRFRDSTHIGGPYATYAHPRHRVRDRRAPGQERRIWPG